MTQVLNVKEIKINKYLQSSLFTNKVKRYMSKFNYYFSQKGQKYEDKKVKYYNKLIINFNENLCNIRRESLNEGFRLQINISYKNYLTNEIVIFYNSNILDYLQVSREAANENYNSFFNFRNKNIISNMNGVELASLSEENFSVNFLYTTFSLSQLVKSSLPPSMFWFWTYGIYGKNETLTVRTTVNTTAKYNLNLLSSDISWYPEPPRVLTSYSGLPNNTLATFAFSGYLDPGTSQDTLSDPTALGQANGCYDYIQKSGTSSISITIGGGTIAWTADSINKIIVALNSNQFSKYAIIIYDIEVGVSGLSSNFEQMFAATKAAKIGCYVTVSHSSPFGFSDSLQIMIGFFASSNIDVISPQLYTEDFGVLNEYTESSYMTWTQFSQYYQNRANPNLQIIPSILSNTSYPNNYGTYELLGTGGINQGKTPVGFSSPNWQIDTGAKDFFVSIGIDNVQNSIQWINGTLTPQS